MRLLTFVAGALTFLVIATLNSGGYRYGASDQAFYIPAILKQLDPARFPRDTALIAPQARYFFVDELVAAVVRQTGLSIETCFALGYVLTLALLYLGLWRLGQHLFVSPLAVWTLIAADTLRHRITRTGVNTLEGYFHPRMLVFAVGIWAVATYLRGRPWLALAMVGVAGLLHPTTAAFFVLFLLVAIWTTEPPARRAVGALATVGLVTLAWLLLAGPMRGAIHPMDPAWRDLLASKDYLFPMHDWAGSAWLANLGTAGLAIGLLVHRRRTGAAAPRETGLLAGVVVLLAGFLVTLPLVTFGSAIFVQLQISRVFWIMDLLATALLIGALVDHRPTGAAVRSGRGRLVVAAVVMAAAVGRGGWVALVEHHDRPLVSLTLPDDDWTRVMRWLDTQSPGTHVLADPGHAWKYGAPLRYAGRDVLLEDVKDTAMAIYSRESAERVLTRRAAIGDATTLTPARVSLLAEQFRVDYVVLDYEVDLPLVRREGAFRIYAAR